MGAMGGGGLPLGALLAVGSRFGWKGILVALLVVGAMTYGGVCGGTSLCDGGQSAQGVTQAPQSGEKDELSTFVGAALDDIQDSWQKRLPGYERTKLVLFRGQVSSACGGASAAVGPFYCPLDRKVYIDLSFYEQLRKQFEAPGDFAQAYVIAHEVGHHIQNLKGKLGKGEVHQIQVELQADCLAGAWAKDAQARDRLEVGDIDEALNAAAQIGDDTIQRRTQGRVQPETWTHGSAEQRAKAFKSGFQNDFRACDI